MPAATRAGSKGVPPAAIMQYGDDAQTCH